MDIVSRDILTGVPVNAQRAMAQGLSELDRLDYIELVPVQNGSKFLAPDGKLYAPLTQQQRVVAEGLFDGLTMAERLHRAGSKAAPRKVINPAMRNGYFQSPVFSNYMLELWLEYKTVTQLGRDDYKHEVAGLGKRAERAGNLSVAKSCLELRGKLEGFFDKDVSNPTTEAEKSLKSVSEELESLLKVARLRAEKVVSEQ
ncbi:MAG: hypothetical protein DRP93_08880 [Candidatus Neomarinimicrobiota bacterium]|nr:MAG: hypothetical protein DRP93_08880 [Candidatus Neomarinimicrobiota bacterium]